MAARARSGERSKIPSAALAATASCDGRRGLTVLGKAGIVREVHGRVRCCIRGCHPCRAVLLRGPVSARLRADCLQRNTLCQRQLALPCPNWGAFQQLQGGAGAHVVPNNAPFGEGAGWVRNSPQSEQPDRSRRRLENSRNLIVQPASHEAKLGARISQRNSPSQQN